MGQLLGTDFNKARDWIYPIHNEQMFQHGFIEQAYDILDQGMGMAENQTVRDRGEALKSA